MMAWVYVFLAKVIWLTKKKKQINESVRISIENLNRFFTENRLRKIVHV